MKTLLSSFVIVFLFPYTIFGASFSDTSLSFYRDAITTLADEGIIAGYGDGRFVPDNTITRAEILKILFGSKGITPTEQNTSCFPDVSPTVWYHGYVCEGVKLGVVKGFEDGTFKPNSPVTVLEALAMGLRLYAIAPESGNPWYVSYQDFAMKNGLLDTASYSLSTPMSRGKASELILKIREYSTTKTPLTYLSKGCKEPKILQSGTHEVTVAGKTRSYILTVPSSYSSSNPAKLIVAIHGRTNSNSMVKGYMGLERQSDFIVAYPAGLPSGSAYSWSSDENIAFIDTLIQTITDSQCVDRGEIHIVAHSLGAWFASKLSCTRGDTFRSMAIVGGGGYITKCGDTPTASLIFQRSDDTLSPESTARATESQMKTLNTCGNTVENVTIGTNSCQKWNDCSTGNPVIWCGSYSTYGNDPHSWPTGGGSAILGWIRSL